MTPGRYGTTVFVCLSEAENDQTIVHLESCFSYQRGRFQVKEFEACVSIKFMEQEIMLNQT